MLVALKGGLKAAASYKIHPKDQISLLSSYGLSCHTYGLA